MSEQATERVSMIWPSELKQQVRDKAGKRGITDYLIEAAQIHMGVSGGMAAQEQEINELRHLIQLLADRLAMGGGEQERREAFMEVELPAWIDTTGWPSTFASLVKPEPVVQVEPEVPQTVEVVAVVPPKQEAAPRAAAPKAKAAPEVPEVQPDPIQTPVQASGSDLLERIRAKAMEKGVDISDAQLRPASTVSKPEPKQPSPEPELPELPRCARCGQELVDGECWTCD